MFDTYWKEKDREGITSGYTSIGFIDFWDRPDGEPGNGWIDPYAEYPAWWDKIELRNNMPVIPKTDKGPILGQNNSGARAMLYRDFGPDFRSNISCSLVWSGIKPYESSPLIHVNPDDDGMALGAWPVTQLSSFLVALIGRRPDMLKVLAIYRYEHRDGEPRRIELRSNGDKFTVWMSKLGDINTMELMGEPLDIPDPLKGSSMHGVAIDVNQDPKRPENQTVILPPFELVKLSTGHTSHNPAWDRNK